MNKYYKIILFWVLLILSFTSFAQETLKRESHEPSGLNPVYALDIGSNFDENGFIPEVYEYYEICTKFKSTLKKLPSDNKYDYLLGQWKLNAIKIVTIPKLEGFDLCDNFAIEKRSGSIYFIDGTPCPIYTNNYGDMYYFTDWRGILKKIVCNHKNIYIYHLVNDFWILDIVQTKGKYSYLKIN